MTKKQQQDLETIEYFIPKVCQKVQITDADRQMFLEYSERGMHKDKIGTWVMDEKYKNGLNALCEGKRWRGIHIHEMYEKGVLDGSMPYYMILGGTDGSIPRSVVDFLKKEMFQGQDAEVIENCYQDILKDEKEFAL